MNIEYEWGFTNCWVSCQFYLLKYSCMTNWNNKVLLFHQPISESDRESSSRRHKKKKKRSRSLTRSPSPSGSGKFKDHVHVFFLNVNGLEMKDLLSTNKHIIWTLTHIYSLNRFVKSIPKFIFKFMSKWAKWNYGIYVKANVIVSPVRMYVRGILWFSRHYAVVRSHDNLKNPYRIASIFYM